MTHNSKQTHSTDEADWQSIETARSAQQRLVFTNGCFDILHVGHIRYLAEARKLGDFLIIGLNSDASVRRLKGDNRPVVGQDERAEVLRALRSVDAVVLFEEDTPLELIRRVRPDVLVKGGDWELDTIVGSDVVRSYGGEVRSLSYFPGNSTTEILRRVQRL